MSNVYVKLCNWSFFYSSTYIFYFICYFRSAPCKVSLPCDRDNGVYLTIFGHSVNLHCFVIISILENYVGYPNIINLKWFNTFLIASQRHYEIQN